MTYRKGLTAVLILACCFLAIAAQAQTVRPNGNNMIPTGKGYGVHAPMLANKAKGGGHGGGGGGNNGIFYHGGPVMNSASGVNVYYIWYGNWSGNSATTILTDLANGIGGTPYFNIETTYYDGNNVAITNAVNYSGSVNDSYSYGTSLSDSNIQSIVAAAISGGLPKDTNGVYFVLTSADVNESSGFCTQYCGWHTHGTIAGSDIKYAFIGNPDRCPSACSVGEAPNGNAGADGMASIISHELDEAASDPDLNAWYDHRGYENADKCAWTFGTTYGPSGAQYNMTFGGRNWLIQQNWVDAGGGYCAVSY